MKGVCTIICTKTMDITSQVSQDTVEVKYEPVFVNNYNIVSLFFYCVYETRGCGLASLNVAREGDYTEGCQTGCSLGNAVFCVPCLSALNGDTQCHIM